MLVSIHTHAQVINRDEPQNNNTIFSELYQIAEKTYGINQELICGELYENLYLGALGTPFIIKEEFTKGSVCYKGKVYNDLQLMYDIYEQKVLIDYRTEHTQLRVYLTKNFLTEFEIYNKKFKKLDLFDDGLDFYQVLEAGEELKCYYHWYKSRVESNHLYPRVSYEFSSDKKKKYLYINGTYTGFRGKSSFISAFPKNKRKSIKKFIKQNKIYMADISDTAMQQLLDYCNSLLDTNEPTSEI